MKKIYKTLLICMMLGFFAISFSAMAGNRDRSGQSGAQHLVIDPWARSSGWSSCGVAETRGLESIFSNISGLSFNKKTSISFTHTQYLSGSNTGININAFAVGQGLTFKNKETGRKTDLGTVAVSVFAMSFGDIPRTTEALPNSDGGSIFSPKLNYIGIHYAKSFNKYIHGGVSFKIVNEGISDLKATGIAIDVGVQYLSGPYENFKIGVTLQNLGLAMHYKGDGIAIRAEKEGTNFKATYEYRKGDFELPALLTIGLSYDFLFFTEEYQSLDRKTRKEEGLTREDAVHRITLAGAFTANAYSRDQFALGIEYGFMKFFQLRAGYLIQSFQIRNIDGKDQLFANQENFFLGPSAGVSVGIPLSKRGKQQLLIDYAYRFTNYWKGNHQVGLRICL